MTGTSLIGMHFIVNGDEDCFQIGKIIDLVQHGNETAPAIYLLQLDGPDADHPLPLELVHIAEMASTRVHGIKNFHLFRTRKDLEAWMTWIETPEDGDEDARPKVVSLVKGKKEH